MMKEKAALLIATGLTATEAARQLGVNRATVGRWQKTPEFQDALDRLRLIEKEKAALLIATGLTAAEAARQLGVNRATVGRWQKTPEFQDALDRLRHEAREAVFASFRHLASKSFDALAEIINNPNAADCDRIKAAELILNHAYKTPERGSDAHSDD